MKIRRFLSVFLLTLLLTGLFCVPQASAVEMPQVNAKAALLMDYESGRMLYGLNEKDTEYPASITKVMTALLTLEAVDQGPDPGSAGHCAVPGQRYGSHRQLCRHQGGRGADGGAAAVLHDAGVRQRGGLHPGGDGVRVSGRLCGPDESASRSWAAPAPTSSTPTGSTIPTTIPPPGISI